MENSDYKYRSFIKKTDVSSKLKNIVEEINLQFSINLTHSYLNV